MIRIYGEIVLICYLHVTQERKNERTKQNKYDSFEKSLFDCICAMCVCLLLLSYFPFIFPHAFFRSEVKLLYG